MVVIVISFNLDFHNRSSSWYDYHCHCWNLLKGRCPVIVNLKAKVEYYLIGSKDYLAILITGFRSDWLIWVNLIVSAILFNEFIHFEYLFASMKLHKFIA